MVLSEFDKDHLMFIIEKFVSEKNFIVCAHCEKGNQCFKKDGITLKKLTYCDTFKNHIIKELKLK